MSKEFRVVLVAATSVNGKITRGDDPHVSDWTSEEDKERFAEIRAAAKVIIIGRKTFEVVNPKPSRDKLRVVLTNTPEKFKEYEVKGQLEFTNENPGELVERLKEEGFTEMLLLGGTEAYSSFLEAGLITDVVLTIEPEFFGEGKPLFSEVPANFSLELQSVERLNKKGTLLVKYKVLNENHSNFIFSRSFCIYFYRQ